MEGIDDRVPDGVEVTKLAGVTDDDVFKDQVTEVVVDGPATAGPPYQFDLVPLEVWQVNLGIGILVNADDDGRLVDVSNQAVARQA